jgi:hypothetical protein
MKINKVVAINWDEMSVDYTATAIQAAEDMPAEGTLREQAGYVWDQLEAAHEEKVWGVQLIKYTPDK